MQARLRLRHVTQAQKGQQTLKSSAAYPIYQWQELSDKRAEEGQYAEGDLVCLHIPQRGRWLYPKLQ